MDSYLTVFENGTFEFTEKRSRFIGHIAHAETTEDAENFIREIKSKYWDARHNVYAYSLKNGISRFSDDGEPHGTAGKPILDVISGKKLTDVVIVVTRYFGGILLGTGGLCRAYTDAAAGVVGVSKINTVSLCNNYFAECDYSQYSVLSSLLSSNSAFLKSSEFSEKVKVFFYSKKENSKELLTIIEETFSSSVSPREIGETYEKT